jgi:hypothetical protein
MNINIVFKILGEKYKKKIDAILNIDAILIFKDWQQIIYNRTVQVLDEGSSKVQVV